MRKLFAVLLLVLSGSVFGYPSTQVWSMYQNGVGLLGTSSTQAGAMALLAAAVPGHTWAVCSWTTYPYSVYAVENGCGSLSGWLTLSGSCNSGDTLSSDGLSCMAAGGGSGGGAYTPPASGASTSASSDNSSGLAAWLNAKIDAVLSWLLSVIISIFSGLWAMFIDLFIFILDSLFDLVLYIVGGMSWDFGVFSPVTYWNQLPADLVSVLNLIGVPIALGMVVTALGIRFVLQLIPFVRWGS